MRNFYGAEQWKEWILECEGSGLGVKEWCELHNLRDNLFFRWRKRLVDRGELEWHPGTRSKLKASTTNSSLPQVVQVNFPVSQETGTGPAAPPADKCHMHDCIMASQVMIETPANGCHIYIGRDFSQETLRKVMEVVMVC